MNGIENGERGVKRSSRIASLTLVCSLLLVAGCAHYPVNARLTQYNPDAGYRYKTVAKANNSDGLFVVLAFSGGGHRAAALSYGVLEELARTDIVWEGQHKRLLDEVQVISAVSGGSFTAAYYALFGDEIFRDYEKVFLRRNIQQALLWRMLSPLNWGRCASPYFSRSDMAAEFYDRHVFRGKTFGDLAQAKRPPFLILNATDMSSSARFEFTQDLFDLLCSDLSTFPVGRAVAASSAFPVLLTPITVNNYGGSCGFIEPPQVESALAQREVLSRGYFKAQEIRNYQDAAHHPYFHLLDGGLSDNLGLRGPLEPVLALGGIRPAMQYFGVKRPRKIVVIAVNAATHHDPGWDKHARAPGLLEVGFAFGDVINRYSFETRELFHESIKQWESELNDGQTGVEPVKVYGIEVSFEQLADPKEREYFDNLPTKFYLPPGAVDRLREVAGRLLRESVSYQELLRDLASEEHNIPNDERKNP
ncbi:MAG TPA: patatin-like phospholipase family protein [Verrucomicrobiae bacterium]|nr:patatin-like phospholipase family protein [Verrucomicrobiae bacterium]